MRAVLDQFAAASGPVSLAEMAQRLAVEPGILEGMIAYWVRKGKLREVFAMAPGAGCARCGVSDTCAFIVQMPRTYELVRENELPIINAVCNCGCGGTKTQ
ncbi:MAG: hypothetical protein IT320_07765 [Anaerolineae bacterium]|nr:hypothetical protein [Anaerolineae bacterium]